MDGLPNHNPGQPPQGQASMNGAPLNTQMMNFVGDPALAAAAAAASLFPNPGMFSNPNAFFAMPQMVIPPGMQAAATSKTAAASGGVAAKPLAASHQSVPLGFNVNSLQQPSGPSNGWAQPMCMTSGGFQGAMVPIQTGDPTNRGLPTANTSSAMQVHLAAAAAAAAAVPNSTPSAGVTSDTSSYKMDNLTSGEKAKQNRERNREHARSTRLRKKAYVQKLKELVEGLHAERTDEVRKRRIAMQHLAEKQNVRRAVVRSFLRFHSNYESDPQKWNTILEDDFWLKQPVTPYRAFRRDEIKQECRITRGIDGVIADAASLSVMVEGIGSRSTRWMHIKRSEVIKEGSTSPDAEGPPHSIVQQNSRYQHTISSLSSSSGSSSGSAGEECRRHLKRPHSETTSKQPVGTTGDTKSGGGQKVSSSGSSNDSSEQQKRSNDFHVYNAPSLPDPKLDSESSNAADDSQGESNDSSGGEADGMKQVCTDSSSSGDEDKLSDSAVKASFPKRRKVAAIGSAVGIIAASVADTGGTADTSLAAPPRRTALPPNIAKSGGIPHSILPPNIAKSGGISHNILPLNIAKSGGISHNVRPITTSVIGNGSARLRLVQPTPLPPFLGLGKRASIAPPVGPTTVGIADARVNAPAAVQQGVTPPEAMPHETVQESVGDPAVVRLSRLPSISPSGAGASSKGKSGVSPMLLSTDVDASSSNSSSQSGEIRAYYHVNEDDMLLTDDALMCPFIFRSQDAVMCGALAECIMPGMLRAQFSPRNKLMSLEMVYDAMGFMQQLERASGSEGTAQIVPGSLEMALSPTANEPRVITMAESPHQIVSVNAAWTKMTKFTQMEVEGRDLSILNGNRTDTDASVRPSKPPHKFSDVAQGRCACSTNIYCGKDMREFVAYVCSYPLTNSEDEITHILHVYRDLPTPSHPHEFSHSNGRGVAEPMTIQ